MKKTFLFIRRTFILTLFAMLFVVGLFNSGLYVNAASTCNADYQQIKVLNSVSLDYGLKYRSVQGTSRYTLNGSYVDQVCNYIEIPSNEGLLITSWSNFQTDAWKMSHVDAVAKNFEATHPGYKVIAITNGDFYDINGTGNFPYSSTGTLISDGNHYKTTPTRSTGYKVVSFTNDGTENSLISYDQSEIAVKELPTLSVYDNDGNIIKNIDINKVNEAPGEGEIAVYFGTFTKKVYNEITTDKNAGKTFTVKEPVYCLPNSVKDFYGLGVIGSLNGGTLKRGEFAICSNNSEVDALLAEGVTIRVQYDWEGEVSNIQNALNAGTQILVNGEAPSNVNSADGSRMSARHPRTAIGVKEDGTIILMVNDGRQESIGRYGSYGNELAAMMKHYGCVNAFNLDGGGSSIMYYRDGDKFVLANKYSDASERSISNTVVVAVKEPELEVTYDSIGSKEVNVSIKVLNNNNHNLNNMLIRVGSKVAEVVDGKATITGLTPLTKYELIVGYELPNGLQFNLAEKYDFATSAREYRFKDIDISDKGDSFEFKLDYADNGKSTKLADAKIYVNGKAYQMVDGKVLISKNEFEVINEIKLEFEVLTIDGYVVTTLINPHAPYLNTLSEAISIMEEMIQDILG